MSDIRKRHIRAGYTDGPDDDSDIRWHCVLDGQPYPCDAIQQADLADRLAEALLHERTANGITMVGLRALSAYEKARAEERNGCDTEPEAPTDE